MSSSKLPKLGIREIRKHPDVITKPANLTPNLEVALCHLVRPLTRAERCIQALGALSPWAQDKQGSPLKRLKAGYQHTPTWGIVIDHVGQVSAVHAEDPYGPHATFRVTRSVGNLSLKEVLQNPARSVEEVGARAQQVPLVKTVDLRGEPVVASNVTEEFSTLGLAPTNAPGYEHFVVNLAALANRAA